MELRHLRYFVAVAEELHFGHAASRLHLSQSSLSEQVRNLESELKVTLLTRTRRQVELTTAGRRFLQEARAILAAAERATGRAREAERDEARKLVIGISPDTDWLLLGKPLRLFAEHDSSVEVLFQNLTPQDQVGALRGGRIDIGFVGLPLEAEGLVAETTDRVRLVVALPARHPMARQDAVRLEALSNEAYALWPRHLSSGTYDHLIAVFQRAGFGPPITMEGGLPSVQTILGMIEAGLTIALVDPILQQMSTAGVVFRRLAGPGVFTETGVIYRRDDTSPILASFLNEFRRTRHRPAEAALRTRKKKAPGWPRAAQGAKGRV